MVEAERPAPIHKEALNGTHLRVPFWLRPTFGTPRVLFLQALQDWIFRELTDWQGPIDLCTPVMIGARGTHKDE
jgi:hypothetical protein